MLAFVPRLLTVPGSSAGAEGLFVWIELHKLWLLAGAVIVIGWLFFGRRD